MKECIFDTKSRRKVFGPKYAVNVTIFIVSQIYVRKFVPLKRSQRVHSILNVEFDSHGKRHIHLQSTIEARSFIFSASEYVLLLGSSERNFLFPSDTLLVRMPT